VHFGSIRFFFVAAIDEQLLLRLFTCGYFTFFLTTPHLMTIRLRVMLSVMDTFQAANKRDTKQNFGMKKAGVKCGNPI
jgi:hypothetical protein